MSQPNILWLLSLPVLALIAFVYLQLQDHSTPYTAVRVSERTAMLGNGYLDPMPAGEKPRLSARDAVEVVERLGEPISDRLKGAGRLKVSLGVIGPPQSGDSGRATYVVSGDNTIPCRPTGGSSSDNRGEVEPGICRWEVRLDANTGERLGSTTGGGSEDPCPTAAKVTYCF